MKIIFRTCDDVHSIHGTNRPFGLTKAEISKYCFLSLVRNGFSKEELIVIGDRLTQEKIQWYKQYSDVVISNDLGNDGSLRFCFQYAKDNFSDDEWIYFCEDDYLHTPTFKIITEDFYNTLKSQNVCIHPCDYPDRYKENKKHHVWVSKYTHWKSIENTTFTFMIKGKTLKENYDVYLQSCIGARDGFLSDSLYKTGKIICVSPMQGLSSHMHEGVMSPIVNWNLILDFIKKNNQTI